MLALLPAGSNLFGAYGIGLAIGFFLYVLILTFATLISKGWGGLVDQGKEKNPFLNATGEG